MRGLAAAEVCSAKSLHGPSLKKNLRQFTQGPVKGSPSALIVRHRHVRCDMRGSDGVSPLRHLHKGLVAPHSALVLLEPLVVKFVPRQLSEQRANTKKEKQWEQANKRGLLAIVHPVWNPALYVNSEQKS